MIIGTFAFVNAIFFSIDILVHGEEGPYRKKEKICAWLFLIPFILDEILCLIPVVGIIANFVFMVTQCINLVLAVYLFVKIRSRCIIPPVCELVLFVVVYLWR